MTTRRWPLVVAVALVATACGPTSAAESPSRQAPDPAAPGAEVPVVPTAAPGTTVSVDLDGRPFRLRVPESYPPGGQAPLLVLLHGYTSNSADHEDYFQLAEEVDRRGFLYALPEGTTGPDGRTFWNATEACCDFHGTGVDDAGYLRRLIDTVTAAYPVDTARVYLVGHSNGGFMALRMACDHASVVTAIVSVAGAATNEPPECAPEHPVGVLQIHGTQDTAIPYQGGANAGRPFPSAVDTVELWRGLNGCAGQPETPAPLDLDSGLPGPETTVMSFAGCQDATQVALWSIVEGSHSPAFTAEFAPAVIDFLHAHHRG